MRRTGPERFWQGRRVFLTGATGLLGSWLAPALLDLGAEVVALVRDSVPHSRLVVEHFLDRVTVVHGSVEDGPLLERALNEYEIEVVFHLAAQTIVGIANRNPISTFETNILGTWRVLEAARRTGSARAIVVASSDKAYGSHGGLPYDETFALRGTHPYDVSKSCADLIAHSYAATYGLPVCITRSGNLYGGGDLNFNRVVPGTIRSVLRGERPIVRSDGTLTRDYLYVEDAVQAYLLLAERLYGDPRLHGEAFNVSREEPLSVVDLVRLITGQMGRADLEPRVLCDAPHEIPHQHLSAAKARARLGWQPAFTLAQGLDRTIAWYRAHLGEARGSPLSLLAS